MSVLTTFKCNSCGDLRKETNHWRRITVNRATNVFQMEDLKDQHAVEDVQLSSSIDCQNDLVFVAHVCGSNCSHQIFDAFMERK